MIPRFLSLFLCLVVWHSIHGSHRLLAQGDAVIRSTFENSEIVVTTTERLAGAVHSLTWNGFEFIDSADHGRQLQSACSFDKALPGPFWAECYNPTEAGSRLDGAGPRSSSRLLEMEAHQNWLHTKTQMAFWLAPGEKSDSRPALNDRILSDHLLEKKIQIGYRSLGNVIDYEVTFTVPDQETHRFAQFEALTGYMPATFSKFWKFDSQSGSLESLSDGPGEQSWPVVLAHESGSHAMGVYSPDQPSAHYEKAGYGRFRFEAEKVVKWNCVFRVRDANKIPPGKYHYQVFVVIGSLAQVRETLKTLVDLRAKEQ